MGLFLKARALVGTLGISYLLDKHTKVLPNGGKSAIPKKQVKETKGGSEVDRGGSKLSAIPP